MSDFEYTYILDVIYPKELAQKVEVDEEVTFGSSRDSDIAITGQGLSSVQGKFRFQNEILTYTQISKDEIIKIGSQTCKKGRMYILDKGDRLTTEKKDGKEEKLKIIIRKKEIIASEEDNEAEQEWEDEQENDSPLDEVTAVFNIDEMTGIFKNPTPKGVKRLIIKSWDFSKEKLQDIIEYIKEIKFKRNKNSHDHKPGTQKQSIAPQKMGGNTFTDPVIGILPRFLGMFYNFFIFAVLYFQILPIIQDILEIKFSIFFKDIHLQLIPYFNKIPLKYDSIPYSQEVLPYLKNILIENEYFNILALFICYDLLFNLLLGVGLGQFSVGLRAKGNFIIVRILSPVRLLFYGLTSPLLIFDLPILLNKKSFKELITLTEITSKSKKVLVFNTLILIPTVVILICNYQILLSSLNGVETTLTKESIQIKRVTLEDESTQALLNIKLPFFMLNAKIPFKLTEVMIPSITQKGSNYSMQVRLYRPEQKSFITIAQSRQILSNKELFTILSQDPLGVGIIHHQQDQAEQSVTQQDNSHIMQSLYEVITFNIKDPLPLVKVIGPISNPYHNIYRTILEKINMNSPSKSMLLNGLSSHFITLEKTSVSTQLSLININSNSIIETKFEFDPKLRADVLGLISKSWATGQSNPDNLTSVDLLSQVTSEGQNQNFIFEGFSSLISLNKILKNEILSSSEIENLTNTYLHLAIHSLKNEDQMLQSYLLDELETLDKWLLISAQKNEDQPLSEFRLGLLAIQKALSSRDESFFKLNK